MKACFAVERQEGLDSVLCRHFHGTPAFVIVDTESGCIGGLENRDINHSLGSCNPVVAMGGNRVDAVAVPGMGLPALMRLHAERIGVYLAIAKTVGENLALLKAGSLRPLSSREACCGFRGQGCRLDQTCGTGSVCDGLQCHGAELKNLSKKDLSCSSPGRCGLPCDRDIRFRHFPL
jgi:predicted Fe-Mo cluster-binding NifX family protein